MLSTGKGFANAMNQCKISVYVIRILVSKSDINGSPNQVEHSV